MPQELRFHLALPARIRTVCHVIQAQTRKNPITVYLDVAKHVANRPLAMIPTRDPQCWELV